MCNLQEIESEIHFLFECPCFMHMYIRQPWLQNIYQNHESFNTLNEARANVNTVGSILFCCMYAYYDIEIRRSGIQVTYVGCHFQ